MKKNIKTNMVSAVLAVFLPSLVFAQPFKGLQGLITAFGGLIKSVIPILFGLSMVYFFWGLSQFILNDAGNEKTREEGKKKIIWGIIAIFVFLSIYGIMAFISNLTGISLDNPKVTTGVSPTGIINP